MRFWRHVVVFAGLACVGCEQSSYELAPVRGKVTIDGRPFNQGKVMFAPLAGDGNPNPGKPAFAVLNADGGFVLSTYDEDDGAIVGEHTVTIIRSARNSNASLSGSSKADDPKFDRITVPRKMHVAAGQDNECNIELTSRDVRRLGQ